jgi:hypothetical protein
MVSELGGLEFEPQPRIYSLCVIPAYRSPYGGARVAQTSGLPRTERRGPVWYVVWGMLEPDKKTPSPLLYHLDFIVELTEGGLPSYMFVLRTATM